MIKVDTKISRLILSSDKNNRKIINDYLLSNNWKQISENKYRKKYLSMFFVIVDENKKNNEIVIEIFVKIDFGIVVSGFNNRFIDKGVAKDINNFINNFISYINDVDKNCKVINTYRTIKSVSPYFVRFIFTIVAPIIIVIIIYLFFLK